jgi:hypothetical protein
MDGLDRISYIESQTHLKQRYPTGWLHLNQPEHHMVIAGRLSFKITYSLALEG